MDFIYLWRDNRVLSKILCCSIPIPVHDLKIKVTDFEFFCVKSLQCQLLQSLWLIWIMFGMNGYKILKCFRKEKHVSGELPCLATGLINDMWWIYNREMNVLNKPLTLSTSLSCHITSQTICMTLLFQIKLNYCNAWTALSLCITVDSAWLWKNYHTRCPVHYFWKKNLWSLSVWTYCFSANFVWYLWYSFWKVW